MIEQLLRDAYQDAARTVNPERVRPLAPAGRRARPARGHLRMTAFAPLAAAAAMVAAIAAAVAVPPLVTSAPGSPATVRAGLPPFLAVLALTPANPPARSLEILSAANGKVLATVRVPGKGGSWLSVTAAGNGTRFVAGASGGTGNCAFTARFYTLTLSASGQPASLTPLTAVVIHLNFVEAIVSADGGVVAYVGQRCHPARGHQDEVVGIIRGGTTRQWSVPAGSNVAGAYLSLSASGNALGYLSMTLGTGQLQVQVLDTRSAPGSLAQAARTVRRVPEETNVAASALSADGTTMYLLTTRDVQVSDEHFTLAGYRAGSEYGKQFRLRSSDVDWGTGLAGTELVIWPSQTFNGASARPYLVDPATGQGTRLWSMPPSLITYYVAW